MRRDESVICGARRRRHRAYPRQLRPSRSDGHHRRRACRHRPGRVAISLAIAPRLSQQHGFLHAGVVVTALDSACGYAALTLMPADMEVLTAEFKVNLLAPAGGDSLVAEGQVVRAGRTLTVCRGDAFTEAVERVHVATMLATIIGRPAPSAQAV
jgi:uncharacterized protein (TIGR00369 family)